MDERQTALADFIERLIQEIQPLQLAHNESVWLANITGERRHEEESARLDTQIRQILARRVDYQFLHGLLESGGVGDPGLQRQLQLLHNDFLAHQIPPEMIA